MPDKFLDALKKLDLSSFASSDPATWSDGMRNTVITMLNKATHVATPILQGQPNGTLAAYLSSDAILLRDPGNWSDGMRNGVISMLYVAKRGSTPDLQGMTNAALAKILHH